MKKKLLKLGIDLLRAVPEREAGAIIGRINRFRIQRIRKRRVPMALILFVTNRCNAACNHCFYWKELSRDTDGLSVAQIKKLLESLRGLRQILLTGGEPFLRKEIVEIVTLFRSIGVRSITIPTNGILTERITDCVSRILRSTDLDALRINVSMDGTRETHDAIRNTPGCYDRARETILRLRNLRQTHRNLQVSVSTVLSRENIANLEEFIREAGKLRVPLMFSFIRGADHNSFGIAPENRKDFNPRKSETIDGLSGFDSVQEILEREAKASSFASWNIFQQLKIRYSIDILKNRKNPLTCLAGHVDGVIHGNGDVSICELTRPVGNLKSVDMDFRKVWWSEEANMMREFAKHCCCIHGCNLLSNMQYDEPTLRNILLDSDYSF
jgi:MoaA/NifB/PqqE/SkfB family radical SAM enzyme